MLGSTPNDRIAQANILISENNRLYKYFNNATSVLAPEMEAVFTTYGVTEPIEEAALEDALSSYASANGITLIRAKGQFLTDMGKFLLEAAVNIGNRYIENNLKSVGIDSIDEAISLCEAMFAWESNAQNEQKAGNYIATTLSEVKTTVTLLDSYASGIGNVNLVYTIAHMASSLKAQVKASTALMVGVNA